MSTQPQSYTAPGPLQMPQASNVPTHGSSKSQMPSSSSSTMQLPSQSKYTLAYSQEPSSSVASALKLHAKVSVQPNTSSSSQTPSPSPSTQMSSAEWSILQEFILIVSIARTHLNLTENLSMLVGLPVHANSSHTTASTLVGVRTNHAFLRCLSGNILARFKDFECLISGVSKLDYINRRGVVLSANCQPTVKSKFRKSPKKCRIDVACKRRCSNFILIPRRRRVSPKESGLSSSPASHSPRNRLHLPCSNTTCTLSSLRAP